MSKISLKAIEETDIALLTSWLNKEYILKWYHDADEWLVEINGRADEFSWIHHYIVMDGNRPIGFCQYYDCYDANEMEDWYDVTNSGDTFSIDYLIGEEEYLGKGFGKLIVSLLTDLIKNEEKANRIIVQPEEDNHSSNHVLMANGYVYDEKNQYYCKWLNESDIEAILSHRYDNGGDLWTTPDNRLLKGAPFSTIESVLYLLELGMEPDNPLLKETAELFFSTWQKDGRFKVYPKGGIYPCQTILVADALCHMGYAADIRLQKTFQHLLDTQYGDGGWRCNKFSFGRGPETEYSNPHPTLMALSAFRFSNYMGKEKALDRAVEFLLEHWRIRSPIGPCQYGIGTLFMQVEYPFRNYNLFQYVYVLSFYEYARKDERFLEALKALESKMADGQVIVERVVPKLANLSFCKKGKPSALATKRYYEILENLK